MKKYIAILLAFFVFPAFAHGLTTEQQNLIKETHDFLLYQKELKLKQYENQTIQDLNLIIECRDSQCVNSIGYTTYQLCKQQMEELSIRGENKQAEKLINNCELLIYNVSKYSENKKGFLLD